MGWERSSEQIIEYLSRYDHDFEALSDETKFFILSRYRDLVGNDQTKNTIDSLIEYMITGIADPLLEQDILVLKQTIEEYWDYKTWREEREKEEESRKRRFRVARVGNEVFLGRNLVQVDDDEYFIPTGFNCLIQCHEKAYPGSKIREYCISNKLISNGVISIRNYNKVCDELNEERLFSYTQRGKELMVSNNKLKKTKNSIVFINCFEKKVHHACLYKGGKEGVPKLSDLISRLKYSWTEINPDRQKRVPNFTRKKNNFDGVVFYDIESPLYPNSNEFCPAMIGMLFIEKNIEERGFEINESSSEYKRFELKKVANDSSVGGMLACDQFIEYLGNIEFKLNKKKKKRNILLIAHNGGRFDNIIVSGSNNLVIKNEIRTSTGLAKLICCPVNNKNLTLTFIDSYKIFPASLKNFTKDMSTCVYKKEFNIGNCLDFDVFLKKRREIKDYLLNDVFSLADAFLNLRKIFLESFCVDIFSYCTIGSIALDINKKISCFRGLYNTYDLPTISFIKKSSYGGRVSVFQRRFSGQEAGKELISLDYNSLYPSAMLECYPVGRFVVIPEKEFSNLINMLNSLNYNKFCIAKCKVKIPRDNFMPLLASREEGYRTVYKCGVIEGIFNNVDLEEAIKYNGAKILHIYKAIEWKKGRKIFAKFVNYVYGLRKTAKQEKNSIEGVFKLILNSSFGKFSQVTTTTTKIVHKDELNKFYGEKFIKDAVKINDNYYSVKVLNKPLKFAQLPNYIGSFILSYSKRLMNRVFENINISEIYYSDTDSVYIDRNNNIPKQMLGNDLGQLKNDYGENKYIQEAIFLAQKRYLLKFNDETYQSKFLGIDVVQAVNQSIVGIDGLEYGGSTCLCANMRDKNKCVVGTCKAKWVFLKELYEKLLKNDDELIQLKNIEKWSRSINAIYINRNESAIIKATVKPYRIEYGNYTFPQGHLDLDPKLDHPKLDWKINFSNKKVLSKRSNREIPERIETNKTHYYNQKDRMIVYDKPYISKNNKCLTCKDAKSNFITINYNGEEMICILTTKLEMYLIDIFGRKYKKIENKQLEDYLYLHLLPKENEAIICLDDEPNTIMKDLFKARGARGARSVTIS